MTLIAHRQGTEPTWNQEFVMKNIPNVLDTLDVEVFSRKTLKEESLGSAVVPVKEALTGEKVDETHDLYDETGKKKTGGRIRLSIYFEDPERKQEEPATETPPQKNEATNAKDDEKPAVSPSPPEVETVAPSVPEASSGAAPAATSASEDQHVHQAKPAPIAPPPVYFPDPDDDVPAEPPASSYIPPHTYSQPVPQHTPPYGGPTGYSQPVQQQGYAQPFQPIPQSNFAGNRRQRPPRNMFAGARFAGNRRRRPGNYYYHFGNRQRGSRNNNLAFAALLAMFTACFCRSAVRQA